MVQLLSTSVLKLLRIVWSFVWKRRLASSGTFWPGNRTPSMAAAAAPVPDPRKRGMFVMVPWEDPFVAGFMV